MFRSPRCFCLMTLTLLALGAGTLWAQDAPKSLPFHDKAYPEMSNPLPEPGPAPLPTGNRQQQSLMADLTRSQDYSASRISSHQPQGGPRDNIYVPADGKEHTIANIKGPGAITHIWTTQRCDGRDFIIRIYWEGSDHPSVETPIGDFFGVAMGMKAEMQSAPIQVTSKGRSRNCWWNMPFNRSARVTIAVSQSLKERRAKEKDRKPREALYFYIDYRTYPKPIKDIHYFHARFQEADPPVRGKSLTLLEAEGDGHFVGVVMGSRNRVKGWFGEGDDIFTVDGKVAMIGTGTEDYFCDAWGFRQFSSLYYGAPVMEGRKLNDRLSVYRFHILDPVPFRKSLKFEIEHWPWDSPIPNSGRNYYSSLCFWYQKTVHRPWPRLERIISNGPWDPDKGRWHTPNSLEAEDLKVLAWRSRVKGSPKPRVQEVRPNLSGDKQLLFNSGGDGQLALIVSAEKAGQYTVKIYCARAHNYGIFELAVNGKEVGEPADTYLHRRDLVRPFWQPKAFSFPGVTLKKGQNIFTFSVKEKNSKSDGYLIGLDCIVLEPEKK